MSSSKKLKIPEYWQKIWSKTHKKHYYFNTKTNFSIWEVPVEELEVYQPEWASSNHSILFPKGKPKSSVNSDLRVNKPSEQGHNKTGQIPKYKQPQKSTRLNYKRPANVDDEEESQSPVRNKKIKSSSFGSQSNVPYTPRYEPPNSLSSDEHDSSVESTNGRDSSRASSVDSCRSTASKKDRNARSRRDFWRENHQYGKKGPTITYTNQVSPWIISPNPFSNLGQTPGVKVDSPLNKLAFENVPGSSNSTNVFSVTQKKKRRRRRKPKQQPIPPVWIKDHFNQEQLLSLVKTEPETRPTTPPLSYSPSDLDVKHRAGPVTPPGSPTTITSPPSELGSPIKASIVNEDKKPLIIASYVNDDNRSPIIASNVNYAKKPPPIIASNLNDDNRPPIIASNLNDDNRPPIIASKVNDDNRLTILASNINDANKRPKIASNLNDDNRPPIIASKVNDANKRPIIASNLNDDNRPPIIASKVNDDNRLTIIASNVNYDNRPPPIVASNVNDDNQNHQRNTQRNDFEKQKTYSQINSVPLLTNQNTFRALSNTLGDQSAQGTKRKSDALDNSKTVWFNLTPSASPSLGIVPPKTTQAESHQKTPAQERLKKFRSSLNAKSPPNQDQSETQDKTKVQEVSCPQDLNSQMCANIIPPQFPTNSVPEHSVKNSFVIPPRRSRSSPASYSSADEAMELASDSEGKCDSMETKDSAAAIDIKEEPMDWEPMSTEEIILKVDEVRSNFVITNESSAKMDFEQVDLSEKVKTISMSTTAITAQRTCIALVLDTNVLLASLEHVERLRDLNVAGCDPLLLYIPWQVFQELDVIKDRRDVNSSLKKQANNAIKYLNSNILYKHKRVYFQTFLEMKKASEIFDLQRPDDKILAACIHLDACFKKLNDATEQYKVILLSDDRNLRNKAMINSISAYSIEECQSSLLAKNSSLPESAVVPDHSQAENQPPKEDHSDDVEREFNNFKDQLLFFLGEVLMDAMKEKMPTVDWKLLIRYKPPWDCQKIFDNFKHHQGSFDFLSKHKLAMNSIKNILIENAKGKILTLLEKRDLLKDVLIFIRGIRHKHVQSMVHVSTNMFEIIEKALNESSVSKTVLSDHLSTSKTAQDAISNEPQSHMNVPPTVLNQPKHPTTADPVKSELPSPPLLGSECETSPSYPKALSNEIENENEETKMILENIHKKLKNILKSNCEFIQQFRTWLDDPHNVSEGHVAPDVVRTTFINKKQQFGVFLTRLEALLQVNYTNISQYNPRQLISNVVESLNSYSDDDLVSIEQFECYLSQTVLWNKLQNGLPAFQRISQIFDETTSVLNEHYTNFRVIS